MDTRTYIEYHVQEKFGGCWGHVWVSPETSLEHSLRVLEECRKDDPETEFRIRKETITREVEILDY